MSDEIDFVESAVPYLLRFLRKRGSRRRDPLRGYIPTATDFIRRARSVDEALEVIDYLERKGDITKDEASKLREKLLKEGLEAFGPHVDYGHYLKHTKEAELG